MSEDIIKQETPPRAAALLIFVLFFSLYSLTMEGVSTGGDPMAMFLVTQSLVEDNDVFLPRYPGLVLQEGINSRAVSKFGVGQSLAELPAYHAGKLIAGKASGEIKSFVHYFVVSFTSPMLAALVCLFVYWTCLRLGYGPAASISVTMMSGLCSLMWPHSKFLFSEPLQALCLAAALHSMVSLRAGGERLFAPLSAGFFLGLLAATKPALVFVLVPFAVYFFFALKSRNDLRKGEKAIFILVFFFALAFWGVIIMGYNYLRFGALFESGYMTLKDRETLHGFKVPLATGLHGLLFSSGKGLILYVPLVIPAAAAFRRFASRMKAEAWLILSVFAVFLLTYAKWNQWHGDYTWGPRFLVPVVPLLLLPLGEFLRQDSGAGKTAARAAVGIFAALSFLVQIPGVAVNYNEYLVMLKHQPPFDISFDASDPGRIDLRDNMLSPHYVPEFSPLAGHLWILKHIVKDRGLPAGKLNEEMAKDFPWKSLAPYARPPDPARAVMPDFWWYYFPHFYPFTARWAHPLAYVFSGVFMISAFALAASFLRRKKA